MCHVQHLSVCVKVPHPFHSSSANSLPTQHINGGLPVQDIGDAGHAAPAGGVLLSLQGTMCPTHQAGPACGVPLAGEWQ